MALNGIDVLVRDDFRCLRGRRLGVVCHQATVDKGFRHLLAHLLTRHHRGEFTIVAGFGPQHGIWGHTQDNMIEWEGYRDPHTGLLFHSLYGEHREPTDAMLEGVDTLVIDLFDVGARYYTFIWTMTLCLRAAERRGIEVIVLDRANPINGIQREGTVLDPKFASFVGLHPLPMRHGMTVGEVARFVAERHYPDVRLQVVETEGWYRAAYLDETDLPWAMPSPNMPTIDTAVVYPGMCLLEGTELSEGRGTTRPFEIFGAPYLDAWRFAEALNAEGLPGVVFRPYYFQPTFQKHAEAYCQGAFLHVTDRRAFLPVLTAVAILREARRQAPEDFAWLSPPYEYERVLMPIDILAGNSWLRKAVDESWPLVQIKHRMEEEIATFSTG